MDQFFLIDGFCEKFDININDEDARNIKTVTDAVSYIDGHKNNWIFRSAGDCLHLFIIKPTTRGFLPGGVLPVFRMLQVF